MKVRVPTIAIGGAIALVLSPAVFLATLSLYLSKSAPEIAVKLWPGNSIARANWASELVLTAKTSSEVVAARNQAVLALAEQPGNVVAARTMGLVADITLNPTLARRWYHYSERYSRRDFATQMALSEEAVARRDVSGALVHYDRALRTSPEAFGVLFPILSRAAEDPGVRPALLQVLARRPQWWKFFMTGFVAGPAPFDAVRFYANGVHLNAADAVDRQILVGAIAKGVAAGDFAGARSLLQNNGFVRNGGFEEPNLLPPFDWELSDDVDLSATIDPGTDGVRGNVLYIHAANGRSGVVAKQLMALRPGHYRLMARFGDIVGDESAPSVITLTCAPAATALAAVRLPAAKASGRSLNEVFDVPANCRGQWLSISTSDLGNAPRRIPWIDQVAIEASGDGPA